VPELPEVEVVRRGLERGVVGRRVADVEVHHPRAVRRHDAGAADFASRLTGRRITAAVRRGKYLWLVLDGDLDDGLDGDVALTGHLGMSGQLLVVPGSKPLEKHLRVRVRFTDRRRELRFVDQRTFGGLFLDPLVEVDGSLLPTSVRHIARDPLDPRFDQEDVVRRLRARTTGVKRALLDQTLVSGIGNIYADEALWRARLHGGRATESLTRPQARSLLDHARDVLLESLGEGGTSFDALYVSAEGVSGLFARRLRAYGREGEPCERCGTPLRREAWMNRSSFSCPRCQPRPRQPR
jgi:formamidopyrimidine-DNA glycosylase